MSRAKHQLSPERLIEAAEAAFQGATEVWCERGGAMPYPADLMGAPDQPYYLQEFTRWEIEEASSFLVRLGMIPKPLSERPG
jgi:hypothetical protein